MKLKAYIALVFTIIIFVGGCATKRQEASGTSAPAPDGPVRIEADSAYQAGDFQKSLDLYSSLVESAPDNPEFLNNKGVILLQAGRPREALDAFESASLLDQTQAEYLVNIGLAQIKLGEHDTALNFFDQALQVSPRNAQALYGKGVAYLALSEPEISLGFFRQAVSADPTHVEAIFMQAYTSQLNNLWDDAANSYTSFLEASEERIQKANAYSNRALCNFKLGRFDDGMRDLEKAMEINDGNPVYYYNRAQGFQMIQQFERAVDDYTRAISRQSNFPEAYINRGELNYLLDKKQRGCADLKRACDLGYCEPYEKYKSAGQCSE